MIRNAIPLFRVGGIQIGVHPSWLIVFALITWSLAAGFLPDALPGIPPAEAWVIGGICTILLFVSVLLHELAHSFVAIRRGLPVSSITLFIFGGVSNLTEESRTPRTEFLIAIVGPLTSFLVAGVSYAIASVPLDARIVVVFGYLAIVNAALGAFNLIPGFPLDGGRVFRSIVWRATGNLRRATEIAGAVGQAVGFGFIALGLYGVFNRDLLGGLWTAAIGWFLQSAAASSVEQMLIDRRLAGMRVRDAFTPDPTSAPPGLTVAELIEEYILKGRHPAVLVTDNGALVGIVTLHDAAKVPAPLRTKTTIAEVMTGSDALVTISPDASLHQAAETLARHEFDQLPVVEDRRPLGVVTRADVVRVLQVREVLDLPPETSAGRGGGVASGREDDGTTGEATGG